ncbi:MAG: TetR/AcrR family transcriptional regulator [Acidobacteriota bacterium]
MAQKGTGAPRLGEPTLTAADWVEAALQLMAEKGVRAFTIDALARRLGVTKGSFYWHFKNRAALVDAALRRWEAQATRDTMSSLDAIPDVRRRLELMLAAASRPPRARSLYAALAEAADDPAVGSALTRVASARVDYLVTCYRELGVPEPLARSLAVLVYAAYRGLVQLAHEAPATLPSNWESYAELVRNAFLPAPPRRG